MNKAYISTLAIALTMGMGAASAAPLVTPAAPAGTVFAGSTFTVGVDISNAVFVNGYQFDFAFDPLLMEFISASQGGFLPFPLFTDPLLDSTDLANGNLLAIANYMADAGVSGSGRLVNLKFKALAPGTASVTATGGLYTSLDDWDLGTQLELQTNTVETIRFDILQPTTVVPEPSTWALGVAGLAALALRWRRQ
ncbi:MAG: cohesin domain-containing protein [Acidobacteria bacterium]|nr:cohesin domain-containing protein [Acidobacteriota bacterium]